MGDMERDSITMALGELKGRVGGLETRIQRHEDHVAGALRDLAIKMDALPEGVRAQIERMDARVRSASGFIETLRQIPGAFYLMIGLCGAAAALITALRGH